MLWFGCMGKRPVMTFVYSAPIPSTECCVLCVYVIASCQKPKYEQSVVYYGGEQQKENEKVFCVQYNINTNEIKSYFTVFRFLFS